MTDVNEGAMRSKGWWEAGVKWKALGIEMTKESGRSGEQLELQRALRCSSFSDYNVYTPTSLYKQGHFVFLLKAPE